MTLRTIALSVGLILAASAAQPVWADGYPDGTPAYLKEQPKAENSSGGIQRKTWLPYRQGPVDQVEPQDVEPLVKSVDGQAVGSNVLTGTKPGPAKCDGRVGAGWEAHEGKRLQEVLESWAACEGWTVHWQTNQQYVLAASATFQSGFVDAATDLVGAFEGAPIPPFEEFHPLNKVIVVTTPTELINQ